MDENAVLAYDPFAEDFGSPSDKILADKIVTARKETRCHICGEPTKKGSRIRTLKGVYEGELRNYRFCNECCKAMELLMTIDDYTKLDARYELWKTSY